MIASVRGAVTARKPDHVVVECAGVGYRVAVSVGDAAARCPARARRCCCTPTS